MKHFSGNKNLPGTEIIYKACPQIENHLSEKNEMLDAGAGVECSL